MKITTSLTSYFHHTYILNVPKKQIYEVFSGSLRVHLVKDTTISSSNATKLHVKIITYMNNDNGFDLIIAVVLAMSYQLGRLLPKNQDLVISFCPGEK